MEIQPSKSGAPESLPSVCFLHDLSSHHPFCVFISDPISCLLTNKPTPLQPNTSYRYLKHPTCLRSRQRNHFTKCSKRFGNTLMQKAANIIIPAHHHTTTSPPRTQPEKSKRVLMPYMLPLIGTSAPFSTNIHLYFS